MAIKDFTEKNPKRKAGASYVHDLSCSMLEMIESLVAMPTLDVDFTELIKQTKAVHTDTALCLDLHIALSLASLMNKIKILSA